MIDINNVKVVGWEEAIRGMRNPKNSWSNSDSGIRCTMDESGISDCLNDDYIDCDHCSVYRVGPKDHERMMDLSAGGPVHAKYRRMIVVYVDIIAPLYWWKEFDTYKVGTVSNSCSTMHKIHERDLTLDDFSHDKLSSENTQILDILIGVINAQRGLYINTNEKTFWDQMIQLLPSSYNQKRTIMLNYEVLSNIYRWRKTHKLDEWRKFCKWIESLPYSEIITVEHRGENNE